MNSVGEKILTAWELLKKITLSKQGRLWDKFFDARTEVACIMDELVAYTFKEDEDKWKEEYEHLTQYAIKGFWPYRSEFKIRITWINATIEDLHILLKDGEEDE